MGTITRCYSFDWLGKVRLEGKKIPQSAMRIYEAMVRCACGSDFTFVTVAGLARKTGLHPSTIERNLKKGIEAGLFAKGYSFEHQREGHFLQPHPELVAHLKMRGKEFRPSGPEKKAEKQVPADRSGGTEGDLQSPLYKREVKKTPLPPTGSVPDQEQHSTASAEQGEDFLTGEQQFEFDCKIDQLDSDLQPVSDAVFAELQQEHSLIPLVAILRSCIVHESGEGVRIETEKYSLRFIEKHLSMLKEVFQQYGITNVSLSVMSDEQQQRHVEKLIARERLITARKQQQARYAAEQAEIAERQRVIGLPLKEQFRLLAENFPQAKNGYRETRPWDFWSAWRVFRQMYNAGEIPLISDLLRFLQKQKLSTDWNRDNGRWIPGLWKWLNSRPWWNGYGTKKSLQERVC